ncbi:dethiobiotin synthase [Sodalis sp. CWE]|uniref:dethiobiotin synthase n=1 Tax=Sodalis sp. CWE TaxID=2803816 RepID=UPI001C7D097B|nr:dethiobiotin synthase [Sodalis sp. CWE]MBX4180955.1 ATP-dependent dethiobiotin synthetase BioD [Sodalis sp. CWE]
MVKRFFITGTDTNIGKTVAACALLQSAVKRGHRAVGYKPVASGCSLTQYGTVSHDALALMSSGNVAINYHQINPFAFIMPTSPHVASRYTGRVIEKTTLSSGLRKLENSADWIIIEGAGGWFTPLGVKFTYADWVLSEQLPVIMVVGIKLGCINHALLTALAIQQAHLLLVGWIANNLKPMMHYCKDYIATLQDKINAPLLGVIPWLDSAEKKHLACYIDFSLL